MVEPGLKRGSAPQAQTLFEDLTPPKLAKSTLAKPTTGRDPGAGRPTKKERRQTDLLLGR